MFRNKSEFKVLAAYNGDSILVKTFTADLNEFVILIDGGTAATFNYSLRKELEGITKIDLLVLTHNDSDHIGGLIAFFKSSKIENIEISNIWVNNPNLIEVNQGEQISYRQAATLESLIKEVKPDSIINNYIHSSNNQYNFSGIKLDILSPSKVILDAIYTTWPSNDNANEQISKISDMIDIASYDRPLKELSLEAFSPDSSITGDIVNASSISFVLYCPDIKILFLADSRSEVIYECLSADYCPTNKLIVDFVKVSHHGSKNNTSCMLLDLIDCNNFIISTNGGISTHRHPSRETIARIIYHNGRDMTIKRNLYINYSIESIKERNGEFINDDDFLSGNWHFTFENQF